MVPSPPVPDDLHGGDGLPAGRPEPAWLDKTALQQPDYPDEAALRLALRQLEKLPPLVTSWEVEALKEELAQAARGEAFLLQGGDCAERFQDCKAEVITRRLKILLQMSMVLVYGLKVPVVRVGRFGGQYAKPRSSAFETRGDERLPSYRGDIINAPAFTPAARRPDPQRLLQAYGASALTLNFTRALVEAGFADLHHPEYWDLDFAHGSPYHAAYETVAGRVQDALQFAEAVGEGPLPGLQRATFYTSHEALHLHYEQALTRHVPRREGVYNLSCHLPWVGLRTSDPDGAHVAYAASIRNPVGVKVGHETSPEKLLRLCDRLDPDQEPGRLVLVGRFGADRVEGGLPTLLRTLRREGRQPLWISDPMHGNTEITDTGVKTRRFERILHELERSFEIHEAEGSHLGGVHFELTGENVTECVGGARGLRETDLERAYTSLVDPRLNAEQSLEMALRLCDLGQ